MLPTADGAAPLRRQEDVMLFAGVYRAVRKGRVLIWGAVVFLLALGFDFKTPATVIRELKHEDSTLHHEAVALSARQDHLTADHEEMRAYLRALAIAQCIDRPRRDTRLMGLPCDQLLSPQNRLQRQLEVP